MKRMHGAVAVSALCLVGCATNGDVKRLDKEILRVREIANEALIQSKEARVIADESKARSERTEEMVNRSFQRSMRK